MLLLFVSNLSFIIHPRNMFMYGLTTLRQISKKGIKGPKAVGDMLDFQRLEVVQMEFFGVDEFTGKKPYFLGLIMFLVGEFIFVDPFYLCTDSSP